MSDGQKSARYRWKIGVIAMTEQKEEKVEKEEGGAHAVQLDMQYIWKTSTNSQNVITRTESTTMWQILSSNPNQTRRNRVKEERKNSNDTADLAVEGEERQHAA